MSGAVAIDSKNVLSFSSFGARQTEISEDQDLNAVSILQGQRYSEMERRLSFYECRQHDYKIYDFDGRIYSPRAGTPLLGAEKAVGYLVPLKQRRPSMPYRLGKIIVDSFTNMLFGENRFPTIRVDGDPKTEDYLQTIARVGRLPLKMVQARNLGGAMGTSAISWCFQNGKPRFEAHNARNLYVHSWEDRPRLVPRKVSEVYTFYRVQWDGKQYANVHYWFRRDWSPEEDVVFKPALLVKDKNPVWVRDEPKCSKHGDGRCHVKWIQNLPSDEIDGKPDYDGQYEAMDSLDVVFSVVTRGAILNLDPTLLLKMDPDLVARAGIKKGSDNALVVGKDGGASYMELGGTSLSIGMDLVDAMRRAILEAAECVVADPDKIAAQGNSSVAQKMMFAPMLAACDVRREQYGTAMTELLTDIYEVTSDKTRTVVTVPNPETGVDEQAKFVVELPPKVTKSPKTDDDGKPTEEMDIKKEPREPGEGGETNLRWPPYFLPTPDDQNKAATTMQLATGTKAFMSPQTATEVFAATMGVDPSAEWQRVKGQAQDDDDKQAEQMKAMTPPGMGGEVNGKDELPPGARPRAAKAGANPFAAKPPPPPGTPKPPGANPFAPKKPAPPEE